MRSRSTRLPLRDLRAMSSSRTASMTNLPVKPRPTPPGLLGPTGDVEVDANSRRGTSENLAHQRRSSIPESRAPRLGSPPSRSMMILATQHPIEAWSCVFEPGEASGHPAGAPATKRASRLRSKHALRSLPWWTACTRSPSLGSPRRLAASRASTGAFRRRAQVDQQPGAYAPPAFGVEDGDA